MWLVNVFEFYTAEINAAFMALRARCRWLKSCFHVDVSASNHSFFIQFMACNLQNAFITEQPARWIYKIDTFFFTSVNAGSFTPFCRRLDTFHNSIFLHFYIGCKSLKSWEMLSFLVQSHFISHIWRSWFFWPKIIVSALICVILDWNGVLLP